MSMRISSGALALLVLAGCSGEKQASVSNSEFANAVAEANSKGGFGWASIRFAS